MGICTSEGEAHLLVGNVCTLVFITETTNWKWSPGLGVLSRPHKHPDWIQQTLLPAIPNYKDSSTEFTLTPWTRSWCRDRKLCHPCLWMLLLH